MTTTFKIGDRVTSTFDRQNRPCKIVAGPDSVGAYHLVRECDGRFFLLGSWHLCLVVPTLAEAVEALKKFYNPETGKLAEFGRPLRSVEMRALQAERREAFKTLFQALDREQNK